MIMLPRPPVVSVSIRIPLVVSIWIVIVSIWVVVIWIVIAGIRVRIVITDGVPTVIIVGIPVKVVGV